MKCESVIGNIAKDLGLDLRTLSSRKARVDSEGTRKRYCDINLSTGDLVTSERMDRESLCGKKPSCVVKADLVLENPLELHRVSIHIQDVNDNSPTFKKILIEIEIRESAAKGYRFSVEKAHDADIGQNAVQRYSLQKTDNFIIAVDSNKVELVLENTLDREKQNEIHLLLTALDGGSPQRSGTVVIHVTVLDANDNAPVFSQNVYKASLPENSPPETIVIKVSATDADEGFNGDVTYDFGHGSGDDLNAFYLILKLAKLKLVVNGAPVSSYLSVNGDTGVMHAVRTFDYEQFRSFKVHVMARDNGSPPLSSNVTVSVFISDVNDNSPQILYPAPEGNSFMTELVPKAAHGGSLVSKVIAVDATPDRTPGCLII
ncbi:hypothetical protein F7725_010145 [Dissostichus mawsoni]|uniref:Cadherin domain-containing protein n=1 Tax=Dissostichus mawsoni TaxID=36200 RepID=A0A7J5XP80_DISMA|nr:hypothetical protein F7725_010145 [Dissostichus mawsoni]